MANFLISVVLFVIVGTSLGCSPIPGYVPPEVDSKIKYSDIVAYGIPRKIQHDPDFPTDMESVYLVDFEVRCIFKGAPLKENIEIYQVGSVPGLCLSTNYTQGTELIVFLKYEDGKLKPSFGEMPGSKAYHDDIIGYCEVETVNYPEGKGKGNNKHECIDAYDNEYDDCVPIPQDTTLPPPPEEITPPMEEKISKGPPSPPLPSSEMSGEVTLNDTELGNHTETPSEKEGYKTEDNVKASLEDPTDGADNIFIHLGTVLFMVFSAFALL